MDGDESDSKQPNKQYRLTLMTGKHGVCMCIDNSSPVLHQLLTCSVTATVTRQDESNLVKERAEERGHMFGRSICGDGTLDGGSRSIGEFRSITEWRGGFGGMERNSE
ncbi:unnamed protein product [Brugia pahangi]|uniref:Uncharacterized protein n=1 Tax=Brugia pahangi TaxID=6280 RepID=A0A0N4TMC2_BRUPA|nr:unnamed protein product [Brugia pahangi]